MYPRRSRIVGALALCALLSCAAERGQAAFVTSPSGLLGPVEVIDFEQFNFSPNPMYLTTAQVIGNSLGTVTWEPTSGNGLIGNGQFTAVYEPFGLGSNGKWSRDGRGGFTGLNSESGIMTYRFATPVSGVGALINYRPENPEPGPEVLILGAGDTILEHIVLSDDPSWEISGTADEQGAFRGFQRNQADIVAFQVRNRGIAVDDLTFTRSVPVSAVPEPSTAVLALAGLAGVAGIQRARRRRPAS
ncbi:PEP-CTERM sorting domain-containing protein [Tautonia sociabilis]|uniref:PEP-CTERM sorting domain-containing protein n=1 Tax=Tautonia sociabilis TaxID=2080755 RepID=A0A432MGV3_9BACT|nr:PEP-CTERM sorting domain-containing protein [Tautonia sociabilis]RUL85909.1 PEP-CTERM sorting domain-containing protein [Tautonia sociabilis]